MNLIHGDCLEAMQGLPDNSIDLVLTDMPYGTTACKWDAVLDLALVWKQLKRLSKPTTPCVLFASQPFTSVLGSSNLAMLKYDWVWQKSRATGHLNAKKMPMKDKEDILVFYEALPVYNPQGLLSTDIQRTNSKSGQSIGAGKSAIAVVSGGLSDKPYQQTSTNYPRQVLKFASEGSTVHPTQKPVLLLEYLIKTYTNPSMTVLDFTMGSGSTGVACANTGRNFVGIEKDLTYFEIAKSRIAKAATQLGR